MRKNQKLWIIAALLALLLAGCAGQAEVAEEAETADEEPRQVTMLTVETPEPEDPPASLRLKAGTGHPALMSCDGNGSFYPQRTVSRAGLCELLAPMLSGLPAEAEETEEQPLFSDYHMGNAGYQAAAALVRAGIIPADDGEFRPRDDVTRGEMSRILRRLGLSLSGDAGERAAALAADVEAGATSRGGAAESADEPILREELAVILERLAGREPQEAALLLAECLPPDIALDDFAWAYITDAVTAGSVPTPEPGVHRAYGWLYAVWEDGTLIRDMDWGVWTFGLDGRYTTGSEELDGYLQYALEASGANELEGSDALKAAYLYVKYHGEYIVRPEDENPLEPGVTGWEYERALRFFRYGGGTCYGYAAAFGLMARALGETAYIVSAQVNQYYGAHAFVVIPEDGVDWVYDVELEDTRPERHGDLALFRIEPMGFYSYWYETDWA